MGNFMLTNQLKLKLSNFGETHRDPWNLPPELQVANNPHNKQNFVKSLIFQAGILLLKLVVGETFGTTFSNSENFYSFLGSKDISKFWLKLKIIEGEQNHLSQHFVSFIEGLLAFHPEHRMSLVKVFNHPWMAMTKEQLLQTKEDLIFKTMEIMTLQNQKIREIQQETMEHQRVKLVAEPEAHI